MGLRHFLPRGKALLLTIVVLVMGPPVLLGLLLLAALAPNVSVTVDAAMVLYAVALVTLGITLFWLVRHWLRPRHSVSVNYNFRLTQSAVPNVMGGRYTFRLEIFYEVLEKGERHTVQQGTIEMKFRAKDHPELLRSCSAHVAAHIAEHGRMAAERYPDHNVLLSPEPTSDQVLEWVETDARQSS